MIRTVTLIKKDFVKLIAKIDYKNNTNLCLIFTNRGGIRVRYNEKDYTEWVASCLEGYDVGYVYEQIINNKSITYSISKDGMVTLRI